LIKAVDVPVVENGKGFLVAVFKARPGRDPIIFIDFSFNQFLLFAE